MRISDIQEVISLEHTAGPEAKEFDGVYAGDLLSRAMGRVNAGNAWITIMNNINVIAVASLADAAVVILAENVRLIPEAAEAAAEHGIPVYTSSESVYTLCAEIARIDGTKRV